MMSEARAGNSRYVHEVGELGNPVVPSAKAAPPKIREAYEILAQRLKEPDDFKRLVAVEALRRLTTRTMATYRDHFRGLFDPMLSDPLPEVRWRAAWALGRMKLSSDALRGAAKDSDDRVAERAVWALGRARDDKAESALLAALDRSPSIQRQAIAGLKRITGLKLGDDPQAWRDSARKAGVSPPEDKNDSGKDSQD
jgi:HEAT repeat protein